MNKSKKMLAGLSVLLMIFGVAPFTAQAQTSGTTTSNLQAQINSLLAIIAQLQARLAQGGTDIGTGTQAYVFASDMTVGSRGDEVTRLQQFLVARGFLTMPAGVAYGYFGPITRSALASFQASQGITPTAGYFGPITRTRINALLAAAQPPTTPGTGTTTPSGGVITTPGVEGSMSVTSSNAGIRSTVYEDENSVPILGFRVQARISDIAVQRVRVNLGSNTRLYNRIFERIYVSDGSNTLVSRDLNSSTVIKDGSNYFIDITGFNYVVPKDSSRDLMIRADVRPSIDSEDRTSYTIALADNGVRGIDGAGIDHYSPSSGSGVSKSVNVQQSLAESSTLRLSLNNSTPRTQSVVASSGVDNNELDKLTLLTFDVRPERSDITLTDLTATIIKSGGGTATASSTVYLFDGSTEIDNATLSGSTVTFNDIDLRISKDTTKTLSLRADIRNANITPVVFTASISGSGITAENSLGDQLSSGDVSGSATGYEITVRNIGPEVTLTSASINTSGAPQGSGSNNQSTSSITATFNMRVRAIGGDIVLGGPASSSPAFSSSSFQVYRNGSPDSSISSSATSTAFSTPSGASTAGLNNSFRIPEGTEVTIPVTFQILGRNSNGSPLTSGLYSIGFEGFSWRDENGNLNSTNFMAGLTEWKTADVSFP